ncbi:MAG: class I SAM-dependent methyltransferase [Candidatus Eisenbacteria bacterium]
MGFHDHFSPAARGYAAFRPHYPAALFVDLAARAPGRRLAWDCGTGSGQAATGLAGHFDRVIATDASAEQIDSARAHPKVTYRTVPAESSGIESSSVDLVTVAQALHWFDRPAFYEEVRRVLVPGGLLAVWCYELMTIAPAIDDLVLKFYKGDIGPCWPPERALVEEGYRTIEFPFDEFTFPAMSIEGTMNLPELAGYLRTWSAVIRYRADKGADPVDVLARELAPLWGDPGERRGVRWPLSVRAGYGP